MYGELARVIADIVKQQFPDLESVYNYDIRARVVSVKPDKGTATVHPLRPDDADDELSPDIPDVPLPTIPTPWGAAYIVPSRGDKVRMKYYYNDPAQPHIVECLEKGYIHGPLYWLDSSTEGADEKVYALRMDGGEIDIGGKTAIIYEDKVRGIWHPQIGDVK